MIGLVGPDELIEVRTFLPLTVSVSARRASVLCRISLSAYCYAEDESDEQGTDANPYPELKNILFIHCSLSFRFLLVQLGGIEPSTPPWQGGSLPLAYNCWLRRQGSNLQPCG